MKRPEGSMRIDGLCGHGVNWMECGQCSTVVQRAMENVPMCHEFLRREEPERMAAMAHYDCADAPVVDAEWYVMERLAKLDPFHYMCEEDVRRYFFPRHSKPTPLASTGRLVLQHWMRTAQDFCTFCGIDYDAMTLAERANHGCDGEMIVRSCDVRPAPNNYSASFLDRECMLHDDHRCSCPPQYRVPQLEGI